MANVTSHIGQIVERISVAMQGYGQYMIDEGADSISMNMLAYGIYNHEEGNEGLIYFWNEKILWLLAEINTVLDWSGFSAFLAALAENNLI